MGALEEYTANKLSPNPPDFLIPEYNYIFSETYNIIIYQEQVMQLAKDMCGFTDIETDVLRKAVGKKDKELLMSQKKKFVEGAVAHSGQDLEVMIGLFDTMEEFSRYAFNKAHSISYAMIAYKTAWLKANYPSEYLACVISEESDVDAKSEYIADARHNNIDVLPPDINLSDRDFSVGKNGEILFGFSSIKGIGSRAIDKIVDCKPYSGMSDFLTKMHQVKGTNKKIIERLIHCGAFDTFGYRRSAMIAGFEKFLFDFQTAVAANPDEKKAIIKNFKNEEDKYFIDPTLEEFPILEILNNERELLGIYISGNPFDIIGSLVKDDVVPIKYIEENITEGQQSILCYVQKVKKILTKAKKEPMAFMDVVDSEGTFGNFVVFPNVFAKLEETIKQDIFCVINFLIKDNNGKKSFIISSVNDVSQRLSESKLSESKGIKSIDIHIDGNFSISKVKTVKSAIDNIAVSEEGDSTVNLIVDINNGLFKLKTFTVDKIDIDILRSFSKIGGIHINRGINERRR